MRGEVLESRQTLLVLTSAHMGRGCPVSYRKGGETPVIAYVWGRRSVLLGHACVAVVDVHKTKRQSQKAAVVLNGQRPGGFQNSPSCPSREGASGTACFLFLSSGWASPEASSALAPPDTQWVNEDGLSNMG